MPLQKVWRSIPQWGVIGLGRLDRCGFRQIPLVKVLLVKKQVGAKEKEFGKMTAQSDGRNRPPTHQSSRPCLLGGKPSMQLSVD